MKFLLAPLLALGLLGGGPNIPNKLAASTAEFTVSYNGQTLGVCTSWRLAQGQFEKWYTALHCVDMNGDGYPEFELNFAVAGVKVTPVAGNHMLDIVELEGGPNAPSLQLAKNPAKRGDAVYTMGMPFGIPWYFSSGVVGWVDTDGWSMYNLPGGPGISGAPVVDKEGKVVGMIQVMYCMDRNSMCPVLGGIGLQNLKLFLMRP